MFISIVWLIILVIGLILLGVACAPLFRGIVAAWISDVKVEYEKALAAAKADLAAANAALTQAKADLAVAELRATTDLNKVKSDAQQLVTAAEAKVSSLMATIETLTGLGKAASPPTPVVEPSAAPVAAQTPATTTQLTPVEQTAALQPVQAAQATT